MTDPDRQPLWVPDEEAARRSAVAGFARYVEGAHGVRLAGYSDLWRWSVEHVAEFWAAIWNTSDIRSEQPPGEVLGSAAMPGAVWFPGVRLNYVTHVFRDRDPGTVAVV